MNSPSRRSVLKRLLLAVLAGALPAPLRRVAATTETDALAARLAACLRHRQSARILGACYLAQAPEHAQRARLVQAITGRRRGRFAAADAATLRGLLREQQRRDFAARRTVDVNGWVLSDTEARLYALAALERPDAPARPGAGAR